MPPHPYRIPAVIALAAAVITLGAAAVGDLPLTRQFAAVYFLAVAVTVALGPRSALRWSLAAALALFAAGQLLTTIGYESASLSQQLFDMLCLVPAGAQFVVALLLLPRTAGRSVPAAIAVALVWSAVLLHLFGVLDEPSWLGPMLIGTWQLQLGTLMIIAILFLTLQRATSWWPVAGAAALSLVAIWTYAGIVGTWAYAYQQDHVDAFLRPGTVIVTTPDPVTAIVTAMTAAVALAGPALLAWGLLRSGAPRSQRTA